MLNGDSLVPPEGVWIVSGQIQGVPVEIFGTHPDVRRCAEEFVRPMVRGDGRHPFDALKFSLTLLTSDQDRSPGAGSKTLLRFANVACFQEGSRFSFHTKDGSFVKADIEAGKAWGRLSKGLLEGGHFILTDLLMAPLMEMLKRRGFFGLHAAALVKEGEGYLFPGGAGSGKTTIALSLVKQRLQYLADDKLLVTAGRNGLVALAFVRHFNIDPDISRHFPELGFLEGLDPLPGTVKRPLDISKVYPESFVPCCSPKFLVHIQSTPDLKSRILRLSPTESFTRLVHQTILSLHKDTAKKQLELLATLVQNTESHLLYNGRDIYGAPERILELLRVVRRNGS